MYAHAVNSLSPSSGHKLNYIFISAMKHLNASFMNVQNNTNRVFFHLFLLLKAHMILKYFIWLLKNKADNQDSTRIINA